MPLILETSDRVLLERVEAAVRSRGVEYRVLPVFDSAVEGWQLEVGDAAFAAMAAVAEACDATLRSERSAIPCAKCGVGMIEKLPQDDPALVEVGVVEYICPKCGAASPIGFN